ncbi:hypothetical protein [Desulfobacter postgatei]|uniref:hypothetical protein n=1 Tax=Desulfobacter postgatei TaxID=2293 RepID=UPI002FDA1F68
MTAIKTTTLNENNSKRGSLMIQEMKAQIISQYGTRETTEALISVFPDADKPEGLHLVIDNPGELDRLISALQSIKIG